MTRKQLVEAIYDSNERWSCLQEHHLYSKKDAKVFCREKKKNCKNCAELLLVQYEKRIIKKFAEEVNEILQVKNEMHKKMGDNNRADITESIINIINQVLSEKLC